ncbi:MAG TPA: carboxymuconolactone decarboxylase family protein [Puia sp.]|nr:carboxymuconolactone decarboxylase family protein [Puia sp.]
MRKVLFIKWMLPAIFLNYTITMNAQDHKKQHLTAQQRSIVSISGLTAIGDLEKLKAQFNTGLDSGLTVGEIKEVLVQLYAYCGFPRSLNGINTLMTVIADRTAKGIKDAAGKEASPISDSDKYQTGKKTLQVLTGRTISALAAMSGVLPQLQAHIGMAMNTGLTKEQLQEAFTIIDNMIGKKEGDLTRSTLDKVIATKK